MEDLIAAVTKAIDELEGYRCSPDVDVAWISSIVEDLQRAVEDAERAMDRWREKEDELNHLGMYPKIRGR